jgi:hypothetical protein
MDYNPVWVLWVRNPVVWLWSPAAEKYFMFPYQDKEKSCEKWMIIKSAADSTKKSNYFNPQKCPRKTQSEGNQILQGADGMEGNTLTIF